MFNSANVHDNLVSAGDLLSLVGYESCKSHQTFARESLALIKNLKKDMRRLFLNGKMTPFWLTEEGNVLREDKTKPVVDFIKWNKAKREYVILQGKKDDVETGVSLAKVMVEHFLLEGAPIESFEITFKNNKKSKTMCALDNLIVEKKGIGTVAVKKAVKVLRKGRFYAYYDSVNACAKDIEIPSRKVSEMAKSGEVYKHFVVAYC